MCISTCSPSLDNLWWPIPESICGPLISRSVVHNYLYLWSITISIFGPLLSPSVAHYYLHLWPTTVLSPSVVHCYLHVGSITISICAPLVFLSLSLINYCYQSKALPARWSRGMILASGVRGPGFKSRMRPILFLLVIISCYNW